MTKYHVQMYINDDNIINLILQKFLLHRLPIADDAEIQFFYVTEKV